MACSCFVEGEFGSWGVDRINFNGKKASIFDPESVYCSLLFVPIEVKNDYEKASKCSSNVYSKLNPPANVSFKNNIITWKNDPYASGYEILIDGIPLKIVKGCHIQYTPQEGLHTVSLMALGDYEKNVLSSNYSKDIYCGTTKHTFFNYHKNILFSYSGALSTVIIPHDITIIDETNQPLTFSNVERIYFHKDVEEIPYSTIAHIKEVYIDKDNPYYKIEDGNIIETKTNKALRPSILGKTYEYNGNLYSTETQSLIEKK